MQYRKGCLPQAMPRRWIHAGAMLLLCLALALPSAKALAQTVLKVTGETKAEINEVHFLFSAPVSQKIFTLEHPPRLVIDVPDVQWQAGKPGLAATAPLVSAVRHALFRPGQRRIVLDLARPIQNPLWQSVVLANGQYRLTLQLTAHPAGQPMPAAPLSSATQPPATLPPIPVTPAPPTVTPSPAPTPPPPMTPPTAPPAQLPEPVAQAPAIVMQPVTGDLPVIVPAFKPEPPAYWATFRFQGQPREILVVAPALKPLEMCLIPPVVVIDAGHGGKDPGTISGKGIREKLVALTYARSLQAALQRTGRYEAKLTRNDDRFLALRERIALAKKMKGTIFISIHADAAEAKEANGFSVYTLSEQASDSEAAMLAARENKADILMDVDLSHESRDVASILIDLAQRETKNKSSELAEAFVEHMRPFASMRKHTHRYAGFAVLKLPDIPSVLVELGFLSNQDDERKLLNADYQKKMVDAMVRSIDRYFRKYEPGLFH